MSATETLPAAAAPKRPVFTGRVTQGHVLRSEWTKLWSLRSTRWSLLFAVVAMAGLGVLIAAVSMGRWSQLSLHDRTTFDSIDRSLGGYHLAQLAIGVLGVLVISGEYSTGMIRSSLMAVPRRLPVLWAKIAVFASVTFVLMLASAFVAFFGAQAILTEHHVNVTLSHPHALRTLVGTVLFMTVTGILCVALGTIVRRTAAGKKFYEADRGHFHHQLIFRFGLNVRQAVLLIYALCIALGLVALALSGGVGALKLA